MSVKVRFLLLLYQAFGRFFEIPEGLFIQFPCHLYERLMTV